MPSGWWQGWLGYEPDGVVHHSAALLRPLDFDGFDEDVVEEPRRHLLNAAVLQQLGEAACAAGDRPVVPGPTEERVDDDGLGGGVERVGKCEHQLAQQFHVQMVSTIHPGWW